MGKVFGFGSASLLRYGSRQARRHSTGATVALGILGAAAAATAAVVAAHRRRAVLGKVVVITGGSGGLGVELATVFGKHGAHLVLASRDQGELDAALVELQKRGAIHNKNTALTVVCDVTKPDECVHVIAETIARYGRVDVLMNVAGIIDVAPFQDQPLEAFEQAMQVNFFGALQMIQAVLPHMQAQGSGSIVNVSSIGGKIGVPHMLPYVASKYALTGLSEGLRAELSGTGVKVTLVCPGLMRTGSQTGAKFGGNSQAEYNWFALSATLPGIAASVQSAARKIYRATADGAAEITITPQAWLASRLVGVAPGISADVAGLMTRAFLPKPNGNKKAVPGKALRQPKLWPLH